MNAKSFIRSTGRWLASGVGLAAVSYGAYVGYTWLRYGHPARMANPDEQDALLDRFIPTYEVAERHQVRIGAPAEVTFAAATEMDLQ